MGFLETSRRLRTDFLEAIERLGRITRSGMRWYSMAGIIATSAAPERSASAHWDGTVKESSYFPRSGPCVKPRTSGAVFRYSTMDIRTGFTRAIGLKSNFSIANTPRQPLPKLTRRLLHSIQNLWKICSSHAADTSPISHLPTILELSGVRYR